MKGATRRHFGTHGAPRPQARATDATPMAGREAAARTYRIPRALRHDVNDATRRRRRREHPDPGRRTLSRSALPVLAVVLVGSLIIAPEALANFIEPKSGGSPNANQIHSLYNIVLYVAAIVAVLVEGALVYSVWRFRAKRSPVAAQIHGNTSLEIGWTVAAALILVVLTVVTFIKLPSIVNPPNSSGNGLVLSASVNAPTPPNGKKLTVCIQGRQFIWRYVYGNGCLQNSFNPKLKAYSYTTMVVPEHTTVVLAIQSTDVIHSWWVPSLGGKVDAVPGYTTYTWFKALHTGTFRGQCAQLCGTNHAAMIAYVKVVPPDQYTAWVARQQKLITAQNAQVGQLRAVLTASNQLGN
jgi:cytochrome c oxidase subunit II